MAARPISKRINRPDPSVLEESEMEQVERLILKHQKYPG
jgi:hypothetical protein